jgi:predicted Zn finger-like uncharacterized protein
MILTCPACATRYSVADDAIGPAGKAVRCTGCSHRWTAMPTSEDELELAATVAAPPKPDPEPERPAANKAPLAFREKVQAQKTVRQAVVNGMIWAGIGTGMAVLAALTVIFRVDVVRVLPRTASAYAAIGLPVNPVGLVFEGVSAKPGLQDGHDALVVSGAMRNIEKRPIVSPALAIKVLDTSGHPVLIRTTDTGSSLILPGQAHNFVISVIDPPPTANDVEVAFAAGHKTKVSAKAATTPRAAPAPAATPALRGSTDVVTALPAIPATAAAVTDLPAGAAVPAPVPVPVPAKPVSDNSPYALHAVHG